MAQKVWLSAQFNPSKGFEILTCKPRKNRKINKDKLGEFFSDNGFGEKNGVYVFAIQHGNKITPWYVGRTGRTFKDEAFEAKHKLPIYNAVLRYRKKGRPIMFFVTKKDQRGHPENRPFDFVETEIIKLCAAENKELRNDRKTKTKVLWLRGVTDDWMRGARPAVATDFCRMVGVELE